MFNFSFLLSGSLELGQSGIGKLTKLQCLFLQELVTLKKKISISKLAEFGVQFGSDRGIFVTNY